MESTSPTTTVRAALYARVSSEQQTQQSTIQSQVEALQERIRDDGLTIEGVVLGPDGRGAGSVFVSAAREGVGGMGTAIVCKADGTFRFAGLEGGVYDLGAHPLGGSDGQQFARARLKGIHAGSTGVELHLEYATTLRGRVVDASGDPVDRATVKMTVPDNPESWTQTGPDGTFELDPPAGRA